MKLKFGSQEDINFRNASMKKDTLIPYLEKRLADKVKCPFCKYIMKSIRKIYIRHSVIEWHDCINANCIHNPFSSKFQQHKWDNYTDYDGNILYNIDPKKSKKEEIDNGK